MTALSDSPPRGRARFLTGTGRRLLLAFGLLVVILAVASAVAWASLSEMQDNLTQVRLEEERVRTVLQLANAVRDQYAHQAHMILLGNDSHLGMYEASHARVEQLTRELSEQGGDPEVHAQIEVIRSASESLDTVFREGILTSVRRDDLEGARSAHDQALTLVLGIQARADQLAAQYEASIAKTEVESEVVHRRARLWTIALLIGGTLFAVVVGLYLGRSVARPMAALEAGAARLAGGDLRTRITLEREDEFGRLAGQFNAMTGAIERHQAALVQHERLAGIGRLAAGVAHEINNPLAVILGYVRLLQKRSGDELRDDLRIIEEEVLRGKEIVEGLLDLARPWHVGEDPVDLGDLARQSVERLRESGAAGEVSLEVAGEAEAVANARAVQQVLMNLLQNAVDAAGAGGSVRVQVQAQEGEARIDVLDSGPGVSPEQLDQIFEPFYTTKPQGTGLGLAVSRAIAAAHGGRIEVEGRPEGGARFSLILPARREA